MPTDPPDSNPFSTRFVRPAANEYLFDDEDSVELILARLEAGDEQGQIVGPHGSGKSTLLCALREELVARGRQIALYELHDGQRRLPATAADIDLWNENTVVIVDGYEQLSWWSRRSLKAACRRAGCGLLVTSHEDVGLTPLYFTLPDERVAQQLVAGLMQGHPPVISAADVTQQFEACEGNVREMLFRLYDLYEERTK